LFNEPAVIALGYGLACSVSMYLPGKSKQVLYPVALQIALP